MCIYMHMYVYRHTHTHTALTSIDHSQVKSTILLF